MSPRWLITAAKAWLLLVGCLAGFSLLPIMIGWQPVVVLTGSMEPAIGPGDVVLVDPHTAPGVGHIVLARDPYVPSGRLMHRVVHILSDGMIETKGDANRQADPRYLAPADVIGVGRMIVPAAGRFLMVFHGPTPRDLVWALLTLASLLTLVFRDRIPTGRGDDDHDHPQSLPAGQRSTVGTGSAPTH